MSEQQITETEEVEHEMFDITDQDHIAGADEMVDSETVEAPGNDSAETPGNPDGVDGDGVDGDGDPETFPRSYVEKLRDENAKYRLRAGQADELANRLHKALVEASGRLMNADDLPFDQSHLDDPDKLTAALDELVEAKPYLANRKPSGNIGQGVSGPDTTVDLAGILRSRA